MQRYEKEHSIMQKITKEQRGTLKDLRGTMKGSKKNMQGHYSPQGRGGRAKSSRADSINLNSAPSPTAGKPRLRHMEED